MATKLSTKSEAASTAAGFGCLLIFALPFAAVGVGMSGAVAWDLCTWQAVQSWVETPATLQSAELKEHDGDDSTTYSVAATYSYQFAGQNYAGERVALHTGSDNVGHYNEDRARELEQIEQAGGQTVCYVNPDDPAQAILFRDLRPGMVAFKMMFALVFGGVGFGLLAASVVGYRKSRREAQLKKASPDKPWQWREDWTAGRIRANAGVAALAITCFAAYWNLISWPAFIAACTGGEVGFGPLAFIGIFPLVGSALAAWAIYLCLARYKWGVSEFEMASLPGVLGGPLAGVIHVPHGVVPQEGFHVRLACVRTEKTTSGGETSSQDIVDWERETTIQRDLSTDGGSATLIPVKFLIPYELPPSGDNINWKLSVHAATPGVDYGAAFEVPVIQTEASSTQELADDEGEEESEKPPDFSTLVRRIGGVVEEATTDRRTLYFPMARNRGMAVFTGIFAIVWIGVCVFLFNSGAPWLFPWLFSGVGVIILWMAVSTCLVSTRLEYDRRGVAYSHRLLGLGRRHEVPQTKIAAIYADNSGVVYNGRSFYKLELCTNSHDRYKLVSDIARQQDAEQLATDIREIVGLSESRTDDGTSRMKLEAELPSDFRRE